MTKHRNPRASVPKRPTLDNRRAELPPEPPEPTPEPDSEPVPDPDDEVDHLVCVLRDQLRRADSYVTTAEKELQEPWGVGGDDGVDDGADEGEGVQDRRNRVEDLVEATKLTVREARYTSDRLTAELALQRRGA